MSVSGAKNEPQKLASCIFFPSNAYGSRQVVYQAGKPVAFCKIHRINAVATSLWRQCASKRRAGWDRYMIHWAVTVQSKKKTNKNKKTPKNTQNTEPATKTPQDTTQTRYGWWSAGQLIGNWNVSEKMITSTRQRQITKKPYRNLWAWEATQHNAETEAPPARSLEITKRKPRGQRSHRLATTWHNPKASNDTAMALGKWDQKGETWCEPELRWHDRRGNGT